MRLLFILSIFFFGFFAHAKELVRVRIATLYSSQIEVSGLAMLFQGEVPEFQKASIASFEHVQIEMKDFAKKIWSYKLANQTGDVKIQTVYSDFLTLEGQNLMVRSEFVPSKILFWAREPKVIDVIAVLDMDEYLKGVLPLEMPLAWPEEALKAQAVVARSFALSQMRSRKDRPYQLDSTVNDQMYRYFLSLTLADQAKLQSALEQTQNQVLVGPHGVVKALYHSDCGGQTEKASHVWGAPGVEVSVKDDFCLLKSPWKYSVDREELKTKLALSFLPDDVQSLGKTSSGRNDRILVAFQDQKRVFSSQDFRRLVGYAKIRSTQFSITKTGDFFNFKGHGFGHGVGMCQWGANTLAKRGFQYKMILNHYFPGYKVANEAF